MGLKPWEAAEKERKKRSRIEEKLTVIHSKGGLVTSPSCTELRGNDQVVITLYRLFIVYGPSQKVGMILSKAAVFS